jgi:hypothetical protein
MCMMSIGTMLHSNYFMQYAYTIKLIIWMGIFEFQVCMYIITIPCPRWLTAAMYMGRSSVPSY